MTRLALPLLVLSLLAAAPAHAGEQRLTLYSKAIEVKPYAGEQHYMPLAPNGVEAPDKPGYITSIRVDVVKKRSARAKGLSIQDVMVHHVVLHAPNAAYAKTEANCFGNFFARGEENQRMPRSGPFGIHNSTPDGRAPGWLLTHMLMNHRPYPFKVYVRTRITYTQEPRTAVTPLWIDTRGCHPDPVYDVPGGRKKGSTHFNRATWRVPESGRIIGAQGHLHGGGKWQRLVNRSCSNERLVTSRAHYGMPRHIFYRVRPILHEPSPISMSRTVTRQGIPVRAGDRLRLTAAYDNQLPHTRVMSIMMAYLAPGEVEECEAQPGDIRIEDVPKRFRKPYPPARVPLMSRPTGAFRPLRGAIEVGDYFFGQRRVVVKRGTEITWRFDGGVQHDVTVANGPRGFSSPWMSGGEEFSYTPRVPGTYGLYCTLHPGYMTQQLRVE